MNPPNLKRWLYVSLALNLFLVTGIGGAAWRWSAATSAQQAKGLRFAADGLSAQQRKAFRQGLRDARREAAASLQTAREGRQDALYLLGADSFDKAAVAAALARTREADIAVRARTEAAVVDFAATLTPDERRKLIDGLQRRTGLVGPAPKPEK
jgi:uncharacterized membrane protein